MSTTTFGIDYAALEQTLGYIDGISKEVASPVYIGAAIDFAHTRMTPFLDAYIDSVAKAAPDTLHHVYEWPRHWDYASHSPTVGDPTQRLWVHTLGGRGKTKHASFQFRASKVPTPVNPTLTSPGKGGKSVKTGVHIFHWKAPVMEMGQHITVDAKLAQYLAFVVYGDLNRPGSSTGTELQTDSSGNSTGIGFAKQTTFTAGGGHTTGQFTQHFFGWWNTMADAIFDEHVAPTLAEDLINEHTLRGLGRITRPTARRMEIIGKSIDKHRGFERAKLEMKKNSRKYIDGAAARRRFLYGL